MGQSNSFSHAHSLRTGDSTYHKAMKRIWMCKAIKGRWRIWGNISIYWSDLWSWFPFSFHTPSSLNHSLYQAQDFALSSVWMWLSLCQRPMNDKWKLSVTHKLNFRSVDTITEINTSIFKRLRSIYKLLLKSSLKSCWVNISRSFSLG